MVAPLLLRYEMTNELYRLQRHGLLPRVAASLAVQAALAPPFQLYSEAVFHERALDLAQRFALAAAYDAHHLAVAEQTGAEFWTADRRLAQAVQPALAWVHLVGV